MGPCLYCKKMIYNTAIAERGYHSQCHEESKAQNARMFKQQERHVREHEKRRARKHQKRINQKLGIEK